MCKKAGTRHTKYPTRQFPLAHRSSQPRSFHLVTHLTLCSLSFPDLFEMRCRKTRSTRAANANPISENNFSQRRILARGFSRLRTLTGSCCGTSPPNYHRSFRSRVLFVVLYSPSSSASILSPVLPCSVSVVPAHFLRTTFKPRSFLAIKECPRSFAVTYDRAGNNDKR